MPHSTCAYLRLFSPAANVRVPPKSEMARGRGSEGDPCDAERAVKRLRPVRKPSGDKTILEFEGIPLSLDDFHRLSPEGYGASCVRAMHVWL